jgi:hypothetical protein
MPIAKQCYTNIKKIEILLIYSIFLQEQHVLYLLDHYEANLLIRHVLVSHHAFLEGADEAIHSLLDSIEPYWLRRLYEPLFLNLLEQLSTIHQMFLPSKNQR